MDILDEAASGGTYTSCRDTEARCVCAHQALALATIGGARALGLDDRIGSLEVGKDADLAAFRIDIARTIPTGDPYLRRDLRASRTISGVGYGPRQNPR